VMHAGKVSTGAGHAGPGALQVLVAALDRVGKSDRPDGGGGRSDRVGEKFRASNFGQVHFAGCVPG
jgi:hypothetical protein